MKNETVSPNAVLISSTQSTQALIDLYLEAEGVSATVFSEVKDAFNYLKDNTPSLIIMEEGIEPDIFMVASRLKMVKRLRNLPMILLLNQSNERTRITAELLHTDYVMTKPINGRRFRDIVRGSLQLLAQVSNF